MKAVDTSMLVTATLLLALTKEEGTAVAVVDDGVAETTPEEEDGDAEEIVIMVVREADSEVKHGIEHGRIGTTAEEETIGVEKIDGKVGEATMELVDQTIKIMLDLNGKVTSDRAVSVKTKAWHIVEGSKERTMTINSKVILNTSDRKVGKEKATTRRR